MGVYKKHHYCLECKNIAIVWYVKIMLYKEWAIVNSS